MAKTINTRIALKVDTLQNWMKDNFIPLKGELCIATLPPLGDGDKPGNPAATTSGVLMKVGNGTDAFSALPYTHALAADVYAWAKQDKLTITKNGTGNVVAGIEWDATANEGKGGIKFTTASVATAEGFEELQEAVNGINEELKTYGDIVTHDASEFQPAGNYKIKQAVVTEVGAANQTLKISQNENGEITATPVDIAITASQVTDLDTGVMSVTGKDAIKATGDADVEVSLAIDPASGNVVLSQSETGLKANVDLSAYRLIDDDEDTKYGIEYDSVNKVIKLTNDTSKTEIDATDFIKDGMIESVELKDNDLIITWNTDAGIDSTTIPLDYLIDVYTIEGIDSDTIDVTASTDGNKHSVKAEVVAGSLTNAHIAANAGIAEGKLSADVQSALVAARNAVQPEDLSGENANITVKVAETANKVATNGVDTAAIANDAVTGDKIADKAIDTAHFADGAVAPKAADLTEALDAEIAGVAEAKAKAAVEALDFTDTAVAGQYVSAVHETDGKISVDRAPLPTYHKIATSGSLKDAVEATDHAIVTEDKDYIIFDCGSSSVNV